MNDKGFLFFQLEREFEREEQRRNIFLELAAHPNDTAPTYHASGWSPITHLISDGDFVKIAAERHNVRVDAKFKIMTNVPKGNNGTYEIRGGPFQGNGTFVNVEQVGREHASFRARDNAAYSHFFICVSRSEAVGGNPILRWRFAFSEPSTPHDPEEAEI